MGRHTVTGCAGPRLLDQGRGADRAARAPPINDGTHQGPQSFRNPSMPQEQAPMTHHPDGPVRAADPTRRAPQPTKRRRRGRRKSRRGRLLRTGAMTVVLVVGVWLAFSVGGALAAPGTDSTAARLAEWARTHHLGFVVNSLEQAQYAANKPSTGGTVQGGIPTVGTAGSSKAAPSIHQQKTASPPAPITPLAPSNLAREGQWQDLYPVKGRTAARVALLRPDTVHTSYLVNVV